nr:hypothetical protein GCM10020092_097750 [Actinoplanes digitatis]
MSLYAASVILVLVALGGFSSADSSTRDSYYTDVNYDNPYSNIEDLFVYDEQGRLVDNARIFDQNGEPLRLGNPYCTDETGAYTEVETLTYPYCPGRAPYRLPEQADPATSAGPAASADPAEEASPGTRPVPAPPGSSRVSPSATTEPGPSASAAATSVAPR